jgi:hypothetical protein
MKKRRPDPAPHPIDELDRPRTVRQLAEYLRSMGEDVSRWWLHRQIREGRLPAVRVGRTTTTARAYFAVRTPGGAP